MVWLDLKWSIGIIMFNDGDDENSWYYILAQSSLNNRIHTILIEIAQCIDFPTIANLEIININIFCHHKRFISHYFFYFYSLILLHLSRNSVGLYEVLKYSPSWIFHVFMLVPLDISAILLPVVYIYCLWFVFISHLKIPSTKSTKMFIYSSSYSLSYILFVSK